MDAASEEGLCKPGKRPYLAEGEGDHRHACVSLHGVSACGGTPGRWFPRQGAAGLSFCDLPANPRQARLFDDDFAACAHGPLPIRRTCAMLLVIWGQCSMSMNRPQTFLRERRS